jgi:signal transduction histidine kinase
MAPKVQKRARQDAPHREDVQVFGAALLVVDSEGTVTRAAGWSAVTEGDAPRSLAAASTADDALLQGIAETVDAARQAGAGVRRVLAVDVDKRRLYAVAAVPQGGLRGGPIAVLAMEVEGPSGVTAREGDTIRQLAHDLKTPLTSVGGAVELLGSGRMGAPSAEQSRVLGLLRRSLDGMLARIEEAAAPYRGAARRREADRGGAAA